MSRDPEHRETFAAEMAARLGIAVTAVAAPEEAAQADVVVTITNAQQPVLKGEWLRPGAHVNAAGGNSLIRGEVDAETVRRAAIVTADSVEDAKLESADLMRAVEIAKKQEKAKTKPLLNVPDEAIVRALAVAKEAI